uniref:Uncharacterized protein n=1 Tax=Rhizophora mucronata TaxID=61149 RepID=A0A2P2KML1_RHIMU
MHSHQMCQRKQVAFSFIYKTSQYNHKNKRPKVQKRIQIKR